MIFNQQMFEEMQLMERMRISEIIETYKKSYKIELEYYVAKWLI